MMMRRTIHAALLAVALAAVVAIAYKPAWRGGFLWDDDYYVTKNPLLVVPDGLRRIWLSLDAPSQYFPLTYTTFRIERSIWDLNPAGYHWVNILLHTANALLRWRLLLSLNIRGAFFAAAIFALHPVQVESVAWITERKNVLMAFFFLLTLLAWQRFLADEQQSRWRFYGCALLAYTLALSAKSTACTLPIALMSILWLRREPIDGRRLMQILPFAFLGFATGLLAMWWERYHQGTRGALFALNPIERLLVASRAIWFYLAKLFWPAKLTFIYPQWKIDAHDPFAYVWLFAVVVMGVIIWYAWRRGIRAPGIASLFFAGTLAPVLGFIMLYTFRYTYVADHYQYLACIGPIALAVGSVANVSAKRKSQRLTTSVGIAALSVLAVLTWRQASNYRDIETLWRTTIAKNPECWMAFNNLGIALIEKGDADGAVRNYHQALRFAPRYAEAHYNLATALLTKGNVQDAIAECTIALQLQPHDPDAHIALGNALLTKGDVDLAIEQYTIARQLNPDSADAHYNLGNALHEKGRMDEAAAEYRAALRLNPELMEAHLNLASILWLGKNEREAMEHYESALRFGPHSEKAQINLAWALASAQDESLRDGVRAVELAEQAIRLLGENYPTVLRIVAAAYAQDRQFPPAIDNARRALSLFESEHNLDGASEMRRELALYESGSVY